MSDSFSIFERHKLEAQNQKYTQTSQKSLSVKTLLKLKDPKKEKSKKDYLRKVKDRPKKHQKK